MLWLRGALFTIAAPGLVAGFIPRWMAAGLAPRGGWWQCGWIPIAAGAAAYLVSLTAFLKAGGTPLIFFARPARVVFGEEPPTLVRSGSYRFSRNPMYLGVVCAIFGQAILYGSPSIAWYGAGVFLFFHAIVVWVEEPHLRRRDPAAFERLCREAPRWLGRRRRGVP